MAHSLFLLFALISLSFCQEVEEIQQGIDISLMLWLIGSDSSALKVFAYIALIVALIVGIYDTVILL